ncbi:DUF1415 domain-containing protein [uncultured Thiothrix sp.]|uniref:DUF1415 domain-containing protein n=1 Tax=uncultured Thiothrix sp. TaxID=223185 RepID=UPI00262CE0BD|nr:DUF1415 domain-containing protein [uncultured Thiothrix sp.]HMT91930.1 DUF1415 domain-containing protein [Thiolinea sp.]
MQTHPQAATVIAQTRQWIEQLVLGYNLCPFAHKPYQLGTIRFSVTPASKPETLLAVLKAELHALQAVSADKVETTLLIHPEALMNFHAYNDFLDDADELLYQEGLEGILQIASFHPQYQFSGTEVDDVENYTNRSPYPMLHLLREDSLEKAIAQHHDVDTIPERNIQVMQQLGVDTLKRILQGKAL